MVVQLTLSDTYVLGQKDTRVSVYRRNLKDLPSIVPFFSFSFGGLLAAGTGGNVGALLSTESSLQGLLPHQ